MAFGRGHGLDQALNKGRQLWISEFAQRARSFFVCLGVSLESIGGIRALERPAASFWESSSRLPTVPCPTTGRRVGVGCATGVLMVFGVNY